MKLITVKVDDRLAERIDRAVEQQREADGEPHRRSAFIRRLLREGLQKLEEAK